MNHHFSGNKTNASPHQDCVWTILTKYLEKREEVLKISRRTNLSIGTNNTNETK